MSESGPPEFRPFRPGGDDPEGRPDPPRPAPRPRRPAAAESPAPKRGGRSPFAVPERGERRRRIENPVLLPETDQEDEEALLEPRRRSTAPSRRDDTPTYLGDRFELLFIVLLFVLAALSVLLTRGGVGMAWDEAYYVDAAQRTLAWLEGRAPEASEVDPVWDAWELEPRGHPSVTRFLTALGIKFFAGSGPPLQAMRLPMALCHGLTVVLLYLLGRRFYGRVTAWLGVLAYLALPRVFGHAHFALTETPMLLWIVLTVYAFLRGLDSRRWAWATGACLGLALATKATAVLLPAILLPWAFFFARRRALGNIYAMLFIAPFVLVLAWPWLWQDTPGRLAKYFFWNFNHRGTGLFYLGEIYGPGNPAPWHYPWVMLAYTVPVTVLGLAVLGVARSLRAPRHHYTGLLFLWGALLPCLVVGLPGSPKYDGVRLFLGSFPFVALLAGIGGGVLVRIAAAMDRPGSPLPGRQAVLGGLVLLLAVNGGFALVASRPHYLGYYNALVRGPAGAEARGLEISYWGEGLNRAALERINEALPPGASLLPRAMNIDVLRYYQRWGWLDRDIRLLEDRGPADFHLLHHRPGFYGPAEWVLVRDWDEQRLLTIRGPADTPLFSLYRTGSDFERHWRRATGRE